MERAPLVGVLALQGNFREHAAMLRRLGAEVVEVRKAQQLEGLDGLVIPGGESTTIMRLARLYGLDQAIRHFPGALLGTCAGMIVLDRNHLDVVDIEVDRNAYGRQVASFEADLEGPSEGEPLRGVFIRAPRVREVGPDVEVLAELDGEPVLLREGRVLVASFHPELTDDTRVHERFLELVRQEKLPPRVSGASLAKETSERRAGQYTEVRPSAASDVSCRQRRQDRICRQHRRAKPVGAPLDQEPGAEAGSAGP